MPLELVVTSPKTIAFCEYQDSEPVGDQVLVRTTVSGIKHGTEMNIYRGAVPFGDSVWDGTLRVFSRRRHGEAPPPVFPPFLGSWAAGVVLEVGPDCRRFRRGDRVHGEWKHRQTALMPEESLYPVDGLADDETMLFTDPARFALAGVHDADIKLGDRVAVFGLGAIGMLALQMARLSGADLVVAVDPLPDRLELARSLGADLTVNPAGCDVGLTIKDATAGKGVDVALEISGSYAALQQAIRSVHREGLVVTVSYYGDSTRSLDLSAEWHHNRVTLRSSMPVWSCSHRSYPMWDLARLTRTAIDLLAEGKLQVKPLIGARVPFERAAEAYAMIDQRRASGVKTVLTYGPQT